MGDASLRAIEHVSAGDVVASRNGTRAVPTFSQFGIRALDDSVLTRHTRAGAQPYGPSGIATVADPPPILYGIYVDPGEDGRSEYFVGDADTQLLVSSEIPRFMAARVAAEALIEVLQRSAPTVLGVLAPVPDDGFADLLDIGLNAVSRTLVASIGRSLDVTGTGASRQSPVPTEASTLAAVRSFARDFGGARGEAYDWRLGTLLDFFVARFGLQFQGVIHLGWRCFALAEGARGMVLAVSLYGLELFDNGRLPVKDAQFRLELAIDGAVSVRVAAVEGSASTDYSYYGSDTVSYFPEWRAVVDQAATEGWTLTVVLASTADGPQYRSTILLPPVISHGYEYLRGSVHDSAGRAVGQVTLDVRCLDADSWAEELRAHRAWTPSQEPVVAELLVEAATDYLVATFADAVRAFAGAASTGGGEALLGVSP